MRRQACDALLRGTAVEFRVPAHSIDAATAMPSTPLARIYHGISTAGARRPVSTGTNRPNGFGLRVRVRSRVVLRPGPGPGCEPDHGMGVKP